MEGKQRKIGAVLSYVSIFVSTLVQLLYTPLLIKMMGQGEYGLYSLVSSIIGYLTVLDLGFGNAIVVYTAKYRAQGKTEEEKKVCNDIVQEGLYNMGVILKDKLEDYPASRTEFNELQSRFPDNIYRLDVYYNMYLIILVFLIFLHKI